MRAKTLILPMRQQLGKFYIAHVCTECRAQYPRKAQAHECCRVGAPYPEAVAAEAKRVRRRAKRLLDWTGLRCD